MGRLQAIEQSTDVVSLTIEVEGAELPGSVAVQAVQIFREVNRVPYARLRIADGDPSRGEFAHSAGDLFQPGNELRVLAGYHGATEAIFTGLVLSQRLVVRRSKRTPRFSSSCARVRTMVGWDLPSTSPAAVRLPWSQISTKARIAASLSID